MHICTKKCYKINEVLLFIFHSCKLLLIVWCCVCAPAFLGMLFFFLFFLFICCFGHQFLLWSPLFPVYFVFCLFSSNDAVTFTEFAVTFVGYRGNKQQLNVHIHTKRVFVYSSANVRDSNATVKMYAYLHTYCECTSKAAMVHNNNDKTTTVMIHKINKFWNWMKA